MGFEDYTDFERHDDNATKAKSVIKSIFGKKAPKTTGVDDEDFTSDRPSGKKTYTIDPGNVRFDLENK